MKPYQDWSGSSPEYLLMYHTSQKCQLWMKTIERLSCQRFFFSSSEICVLPLCNQLWRNPDICCHSCHLLDRTSFAAPLHGILVAIFLARYKGHSSLDFHVCVCMRVCVCVFEVVLLPLLEIDQCYLYKVWKLINSIIRRKKEKGKCIAVLTKNTFKVKRCRLSINFSIENNI